MLPTALEAVGLLLLAIGLLLAGNSRQLVNYYGLNGGSQLITHNASQAVHTGLTKLDSLGLSNQLVTFVLWTVIGLLCFGVVQGVVYIGKELTEQERISSNKYVHPGNFARAVFWQRLLADTLVLLLAILLLVGGVYGLLAYALPVALTYSRSFLVGVHWLRVGDFLMAVGILFGWLLALAIVVKLGINRRRLLNH